MEDIPPLVLQHILGLVPFKDRRACRQVCSRWLAETGTSPFVGLSLKIDSRQPGCVEFLNSVFVKEINFADLILEGNEDKDFWMNLKLYGCKTVVLSGYTSPLFINGNLLRENNWAHLAKLYFCGNFLCQELWQYGEDQPIPPTCSLPNLQELQMILPLSSINKFRQTASESERLSQLTHKNCSYLLSVIQSPYLKSFHLVLYTSYYWDLEPLHRFIENFGAHLEELVISPIRKMEREQLPNPYPNASRILNPNTKMTKLRSIYYQNLHCTQQFWMDLARKQNHLEEIFVNFAGFPRRGFQDFLTNIVVQNYETLKSLYIIANENGFTNTTTGVEVDMTPLSPLCQLEVLVISIRDRDSDDYPSKPTHSGLVKYRMNYGIKNLHDLPHTLKVFKSTFVPDLNFSGARFLQENPNLEELELPCITRTGLMKEQCQYSDFVHAALRHRRLNVFKIGFRNELNEPITFKPGSLSFRHYESGQCIPNSSDRLHEILKDEGLIEDVFIGGVSSLMLMYYRNFFEALDANAIPGRKYKQPFYKDSKVSYVKIGERVADVAVECWIGFSFNWWSPPPSNLLEDAQPTDFHAVSSFFKANIEFMRMTEIDPWNQDEEVTTELTDADQTEVKYFDSDGFMSTRTSRLVQQFSEEESDDSD